MRRNRNTRVVAQFVPLVLLIALVIAAILCLLAAQERSTPATIACGVTLALSVAALAGWVLVTDHRLRSGAAPNELTRRQRRRLWAEFERDFWSDVEHRQSSARSNPDASPPA